MKKGYKIKLNLDIVEGYKNNSQRSRVLTENWVNFNIYCPCCGKKPLQHFENNRPVADFICQLCSEEFELKSKQGKFSTIINDGAYHTMLERVQSDSNPNFFFLTYSKTYDVQNFLVLPKQFVTVDTIIKRNPCLLLLKGRVGLDVRLIYHRRPLKVESFW